MAFEPTTREKIVKAKAKQRRLNQVREVTKAMNIVMDYLDDRRTEYVEFQAIQNHVDSVAPRITAGAIIIAVGMLRTHHMIWPFGSFETLVTMNSFKIAN